MFIGNKLTKPLLRVSREWHHEKAEDEGQEKPNGGVRHRSLLRLWT
jgi:hypothetical protein